jgi:hypothetical protein
MLIDVNSVDLYLIQQNSHVIMPISKVWLFGFPILFFVQNYSVKVLIFQNKVFGNLNKVTVRQARYRRNI